jgi:hypothetical protein
MDFDDCALLNQPVKLLIRQKIKEEITIDMTDAVWIYHRLQNLIE